MNFFIVYIYSLVILLFIKMTIKRPEWIDWLFRIVFGVFVIFITVTTIDSLVSGVNSEDYFKMHNLTRFRSVLSHTFCFVMWVKVLKIKIWHWFGKSL